MTQPGIEPRSPRPLANTLTARPMSSLGIFLNPWRVGKLISENLKIEGMFKQVNLSCIKKTKHNLISNCVS